jgi:hypothetical protein
MRLTDANSSFFSNDSPRFQAAQLLVHLLEHQEIAHLGTHKGSDAADFCADFIEQFSKRLLEAKATPAR